MLREFIGLAICACVIARRSGVLGEDRPLGRPPHVNDVVFDCAWRYYALQYASQIQPWLTAAQLQLVNDSLAFETACAGIAYSPPAPLPSTRAKRLPASAPGLNSSGCIGTCVFVDSNAGSDSNPGTESAPLRTIPAALNATRESGSLSPTVILRNGTYFINATITLTPKDSNLTITAYDGESPIISGGVPVEVSWSPYNISNTTSWGPVLVNENAVYGQCGSYPDVPNKGSTPTWQACQATCFASPGVCTAWTWNGPGISAPFTNVCCWRTDGEFPLTAENSTWSQGQSTPVNIWKADLSVLLPGLAAMPALQINGARATLARYPNANAELDLFPEGYITSGGQWLAPANEEEAPFTYTVVLPPGMEDPGAGIYINYTTGIGGTAARYSPPRSFWASADFGPQHYQPTATCDRWQEMHLRSPSGLDFEGMLPHAPYEHGTGAMIHTWRQGHWYSWMFELGEQLSPQAFNFSAGGTQGGEGCDTAAEWWIENVFEELDAQNEYFYDAASGSLYFNYNATPGTTPPTALVLPTVATFFSVQGSQEFPVVGVTFQGLTFTAGPPTFMEPRGVPSGGDWALERMGAVLLAGTQSATVANCTFTRLDGNAVFLSGYNRNATIAQSTFEWLGQSAIAAWGLTDDWDGRSGDQPRFTSVLGNFVYSIGLIQKQSSFYFQAASCQNTIAGNIAFNLPRAAFNFDDGFGGATELVDNLGFNTCQESSDHGVFNSWSRMPFVTLVRDGVTPSAIPAVNRVHHNFIVANYGADGGCLDNDDGSSWYDIYDNFCVYGGHKSDFDGHSKRSFGNLHVYPAVYGPRCVDIGAQILPMVGYAEVYENNTCILAAAGQTVMSAEKHGPTIPAPANFTVTMGGNTIYVPDASCVVNFGSTVTFQAFQAAGYDHGSVVNGTMPDAQTIIEWGMTLLG